MKATGYNIRVYGILRDLQGCILLTDERRDNFCMTKLPGGGHELGEGLADGLRREWKEELGIFIEVGELVYINDFLQISAFNRKEQLLSIYYVVKYAHAEQIPVVSRRFEFPEGEADAQTFRWAEIDELKAEDLTFPVDRVVLSRIQTRN